MNLDLTLPMNKIRKTPLKSTYALIAWVVIAIGIFPSIAAARVTQEMKDQVTQLVKVTYGKDFGQDSMTYWISQLDAGKSLEQVAQLLYDSPSAKAIFPSFLLPEEIVTKLYQNAFGRAPDTETLAKWTSELKGGKNVGTLIVGLIKAASAQASVPKIDEKQKATTGSALTDLLEIAEDLKIEQEDDSAFYKGAVKRLTDEVKALEAKLESSTMSADERKAANDTLTARRKELAEAQPAKVYEELKSLKTKLDSATTDVELEAVKKELSKHQQALNPLLAYAGNNSLPTGGPQNRVMDDAGLKNLRAINDRVVTGLTGGGKSCRTSYNTTTHSYQTVCN